MDLETLLKSEGLPSNTLRSLQGWQENGILQLRIAGKEAHAIWNRLVEHAPTIGYYPVITTNENVDFLTRNPPVESASTARREALEKAKQQSFDHWLEQQRDPTFQVAHYLSIAERIEKFHTGDPVARIFRDTAEDWRNRPPWQFDPVSCRWPDEPVHVRPPEELFCVYSGLEHAPAETAAVLFVATADSCEVPAYLLFGGFNSCPNPEVHVAMLRSMHERFGARLIVLNTGTIGFVVSRRPANREEALRLATDFLTYAESFEGTAYNRQSAGEIAAYLLASDYWGFWWD